VGFIEDGAGGGSAATFGQTQAYRDIMAYLAEPASSEPDFSKFDFSKYGDVKDEEPVSLFGKSDLKVFHDRFNEQYNRFKDTKGDGVFRVYAHGNKTLIWDDNRFIRSAKDFDDVMSIKNPRWLEVDKMKSPMLFLYSCLSAVGNEHGESIGRKISIKHPNVTVVAFDGYVDYSPSLRGMGRVNKDPHLADRKGYMVVYKNGKVMYSKLYKDL